MQYNKIIFDNAYFQVFVGPLPDDFLRISVSMQQQQEAADRQAAIALHQQLVGGQQMVQQQGLIER